ncbi:MAG TPA: DUF1501 domain-containing protein, partial [Pirellulaceae bacterium]|nr:DUF1501 domain-containing protein [Pirellulaceae bacterium]
MALHNFCDGVRRRDFLKAGAIGGGLSLAGYLRMAQAGEVAKDAKAKAGIMIYLGGGPTHMDTFDLKPDAPSEYRGEFNPIETNVPGIRISEHLPNLAKCADKYAILRGVSHTLAAHELGKMYMNSGNRPLPSLTFPAYGSVVSMEAQASPDLPKTVSIPNSPHPAGYLGISHNSLATGSSPAFGKTFTVRGMSLGRGLTVSDVEKRQKLLTDLDSTFRGIDNDTEILAGLDKFSEQAHNIISSKRSREAFDISQENVAIAKTFGENGFGQSCLLAVRLIESGVKFVTVTIGGWDTHQDNFTKLKTKLLPELDTGVAALLTTLSERGMLDSTSVMLTGEFGRTPKINARGGRDHWPRAMFVLMAGGGMKGGQVIGASDEKGMGPAEKAITPDNVAASFYHSLGI